MKIPYGFQNNDGNHNINSSQAEIVKAIYALYLNGYSLGRIVEHLAQQQIPSPSGKETWGRAAIDKLLGNRKYLCGIISLEQYAAVQVEKERRSNTTDTNQRKASRYNSTSPFGGILTCGHCGRGYRRITRPSGEIVWRCADRVENRKNANCTNKSSVSNDAINDAVCSRFHLTTITVPLLSTHFHSIIIYPDKIDFE